MTVSVASRPIHRHTGVSEVGRVVLGLIDGGPQWLSWAILDPRARYHFEDESALVSGVQTGLHNSPFVLLPTLGLMVSPVKLMTMSLADLRTLAQANAGDKTPVVKGRLKTALGGDLLTQTDLARITPFLEGLKVNDAPVFQCPTFADQLALSDLLTENQPLGDNYGAEAAAFAVDQARTPLEFVDYYRAYLQYIAAAGALGDTAAQRQAGAQTAIDTLLPLLFGALDCPRVDGLVAPWEVAAAIDEWLMMGRQLGFSRLSQGVQQMIANGVFPRPTGEDVEALGEAYLARAQGLLKSAELVPGQLGQDGATCTFTVSRGDEEAVIALGPDGIISLSSYRPWALPQSAAPPPLTKPEKKS